MLIYRLDNNRSQKLHTADLIKFFVHVVCGRKLAQSSSGGIVMYHVGLLPVLARTSLPLNGISIGSAIFCMADGRDQYTDRQTDRIERQKRRPVDHTTNRHAWT